MNLDDRSASAFAAPLLSRDEAMSTLDPRGHRESPTQLAHIVVARSSRSSSSVAHSSPGSVSSKGHRVEELSSGQFLPSVPQPKLRTQRAPAAGLPLEQVAELYMTRASTWSLASSDIDALLKSGIGEHIYRLVLSLSLTYHIVTSDFFQVLLFPWVLEPYCNADPQLRAMIDSNLLNACCQQMSAVNAWEHAFLYSGLPIPGWGAQALQPSTATREARSRVTVRNMKLP